MTKTDFISWCHQINQAEMPLIIGILTMIREHRAQEIEISERPRVKPFVAVMRPTGGFDWHAVAKRIHQVQVAVGMSDEQLAAEVTLLPATVTRWKREPGHMRMPHRAMHVFLERHGFTLRWLLLGDPLPAATADKLADLTNVVPLGARRK